MRAMKHKTEIDTPVEMISTLLAKVPDSFAEAKARFEQIDEACRAFTADNDPLAASISETIRLLRIRTDELRKLTSEVRDIPPAAAPESEQPGEPETSADFSAGTTEVSSVATSAPSIPDDYDENADQIPTTALPVVTPPPVVVQERDERAVDQAAYALEKAESAKLAARWQDREKLLYKDIIHLFELGDHAGAMTSLERLLMLAPAAEELSAFLGKNEKTLLRLYRDHLGSMDRVTLPSKARKHVRIPTPDADLMLKIIRMSDGHRPIREFIKKIPSSELHILIVISHLTRSGYLELA